MPLPTSSVQEKTALVTDPGRRRSMRVLLSIPITLSGKDIKNKEFTEETRTLVVNAHGGLITLAAHVKAGQEVTVAHKTTHENLKCRIVHLGNAQGGKTQIAIEFVKPSPSFWRIDFPPDDWIAPED